MCLSAYHSLLSLHSSEDALTASLPLHPLPHPHVPTEANRSGTLSSVFDYNAALEANIVFERKYKKRKSLF